MAVNIDEDLLVSQRVDINSATPIRDQVLRIAVYDEFKAYENYTAIINKFGAVQPFVNIKDAEAVHYSELIPLLQKYQVEVPINDWIDKLEIPNSYIEACELGVATEIKNIAMYDNLIQFTQDADIKDVLFRLQAASYNNHLPAFRNAVINFYTSQNSATSGFNQDELFQKLGEYQGMFDDIMSGNIDQNKISEILSKLNISMLGGAAFGAASIALINSYLTKKDEE